jgi:hypothetical protein
MAFRNQRDRGGILRKSFETLLVEQCAPTLAGLKPGSLFRYEGDSRQAARQQVRRWDTAFQPLGLRATILKDCTRTGASMVYIYRPAWLERIFRDDQTAAFLSAYGYPDAGVAERLEVLSRRYCLEREMPHEIGVFLGYPLEDVVGFIRHKGRNFTYCGCWKCYGDPDAAQKCFDRYRRCTLAYQSRYRRGTPIMQLVVAA